MSPARPRCWQSASAVTAAAGPATCPPTTTRCCRQRPQPLADSLGQGARSRRHTAVPPGIPLCAPGQLRPGRGPHGFCWVCSAKATSGGLGVPGELLPPGTVALHIHSSPCAGDGGTAWQRGTSTFSCPIGAGRAGAGTWSGPGSFLLQSSFPPPGVSALLPIKGPSCTPQMGTPNFPLLSPGEILPMQGEGHAPCPAAPFTPTCFQFPSATERSGGRKKKKEKETEKEKRNPNPTQPFLANQNQA